MSVHLVLRGAAEGRVHDVHVGVVLLIGKLERLDRLVPRVRQRVDRPERHLMERDGRLVIPASGLGVRNVEHDRTSSILRIESPPLALGIGGIEKQQRSRLG